MRYLIPLRHGKGVASLLITLMMSLLILFVVPFLSFLDKPLLPLLSHRLMLVLVFLLVWLVYYLVRYGALASASEEQLKALRQHGEVRRQRRDAKRQLDRWLARVKGAAGWRAAKEARDQSWFLALAHGAEHSGASIQQLWPVMPGDAAVNGVLRSYLSNELKILSADVASDFSYWDVQGFWSLLVQRISKLRKAHPFQGVVVILRLADLQDHATLQRFSHSLQAIQSEAQGQLPVYLVVTDLEGLEGFNEFAASLSLAEQNQLFGISLPFGNEGARQNMVADALADLHRRLEATLSHSLYQERQLERRKLLLRFPAQFEHRCNQLIDGLNYCLPTSKALPLRSIHFVGQRQSETLPAVAGELGRSVPAIWMFTQRWWQDLLAAERNIAAPDRFWLRRRRLRHGVMGVGLGLVFATIAAVQVLSYRAGQQQLDEVQQSIVRHEAVVEKDRIPSTERVLTLVKLWMNTIDQQAQSLSFMHWPGLSVTAHLREGLASYRQRLHRESVLPLVKLKAEQVLLETVDHPENVLSTLKVYLMLGQPEQRDDAMIAQWYREHMEDELGVQPVRGQWLEERVIEALQYNTAALPVDAALIANAREQLNKIPRDQQLYLRLKQIARYRDLGDFQFAANLGYEVAETFEGGFFTIPGLYTLKGYSQVFEPELMRLLGEYEEERWVLGASVDTPSGEDLDQLRASVQRAYADDYVKYWQTGLSQLRLVRTHNLDHVVALLAALTKPSSPLRLTLQATAEHTNYSLTAAAEAATEQAAAASALGGAAAKTARKVTKVSKALSAFKQDINSQSHLAQIRDRFKDIHRLVRKEGEQQAAVDSLVRQLNDLQQYLSPMALGNQRESLYKASVKRFQNDGADVLGQLRIGSRQLPEPVRSWMVDLTEQVWAMMLQEAQRHIDMAYMAEIKTFYDAHLDRRYPLYRDAKLETSFEHFSEFFRPQGIEERFFQDYLSPFVETGRGRWSVRKVDGRGLFLSSEALQQFRRAQRIRSGMFGTKPDFKIKMVLRPLFLDANVSRFELRLDDQRMSYRHGPQRPIHVEWPSNSSAPGVGVAFEDYNGLLAKHSFDGLWSFPRLLEQFELQSERSGGPYQLGYELEGRRVVYSLQGGSDLQVIVQRELQQYRLSDLAGG